MTLTDLQRTEQLKPGDKCEFRYPASRRWQPGTVVLNGGYHYWHVQDVQGAGVTGLYIEHVRAPGHRPVVNMTETIWLGPGLEQTIDDDGSGAVLSPNGFYRYSLWRTWDPDGTHGRALFIGLNPSTADATLDDPTIRRCARYARDWGYGGLWMANLYAYRATDPKQLNISGQPDLISGGQINDGWITGLAEKAAITIACWGAHPGPDPRRPARVAELTGPLHCLAVTRNGQPRHPLYMPASAAPIPWPASS